MYTGKCICSSLFLQTSFLLPWVRWSWRRQWWGRGKSFPAVTGGWWYRRPEPPAVTSAPIRKFARFHSGLQLKGDTEVWVYSFQSRKLFLISRQGIYHDSSLCNTGLFCTLFISGTLPLFFLCHLIEIPLFSLLTQNLHSIFHLLIGRQSCYSSST